MAKYTSGDQLNLKIGVESHSESLTALEVVGRVGIGTTSATVPLDVVGDVKVSGALTAVSFSGDGSGLTNVVSSGTVSFASTAGIATYTSEWTISANGSSDYRFSGPGFDGTENDPTIYLTRGQQYKFTNNLGAHPFQIQSILGGTAYNDGIVNNGVSNGTLTWDVQMDAPSVLYYQCTSHAGMNGKIYIVDAGIGTDASVNTSGIITASQFHGDGSNLTGTGIGANDSVNTTGIITASQFHGDGSNLTGLTAGDVGALAGVSIREEGSVVGTAGSVGDINFVSGNLSATASGAGATITLSDTPSFTSSVVGSAVTINSTGIDVTGVVTATSFEGDGSNLTGLVAGLFVSNDTGIHTTSNVGVGTTTANGAADSNNTTILNAGIVTANFYYGDGSNLTSLPAGASSGEFFTGITSSVQITPLSYETSVFTFPSTAGKQYVIESINVANVDTSVGVGTTVNIIASIQDATAGEQTYIAYNVPIVNGGVIELLKNPIVAGPSDVIKMWTTNESYIGVNTAAEVYMNYDEFTSTDYVKAFASTVSIATTDVTDILTSTSNPTVIESIHLANRTDTGDYPVSVRITQGTSTSHLAKDLLIPRYATVDILDRPKRIETDGIIQVEVGSTSTIDVIIAGKKITS